MSADKPIVINSESEDEDKKSIADELLELLTPFRLGPSHGLNLEVGHIQEALRKMHDNKVVPKIEVLQKSPSKYVLETRVYGEQIQYMQKNIPGDCFLLVDSEYMASLEQNGGQVIKTIVDKNGNEKPSVGTSGAFLEYTIDVMTFTYRHLIGDFGLVRMTVYRHVLYPFDKQMTPAQLKTYLTTQEKVVDLDPSNRDAVCALFPNAKNDTSRTLHKVNEYLLENETLVKVFKHCSKHGIATAGFTKDPTAEMKRICAHLGIKHMPPCINAMKLATELVRCGSRTISLEQVGQWLCLPKMDLSKYPFDDVHCCPTAMILNAKAEICDLGGPMWLALTKYGLRDTCIVTVLIAVAIQTYWYELEECMPSGRKFDGAAAAPQAGAAKRRKT